MKVLFYILSIAILIISTPNLCYAKKKSDKLAPTWIKNTPEQINSSYYFKVVETDAGSELTVARMHSQKELIRSIGRTFNIQVSDKLESQSITTYSKNNIEYSNKDIYSLNIESNDDDVNIYYEKIDEYYEIDKVKGEVIFKLYTLFAVAQPNVSSPQFDSFTKTNKYGVSAMARSLIPGWGQFYKGSKVKGSLMLGGTAAFAIAAVIANNQANSYYDKVSHTYNVDYIRSYVTNGDNCISMRNVFIGTATAIYIYNLIDAIAAPGARQIKIKKAIIMPIAMNGNTFGISGNLKF